jgi:molecular chaperone DnaK (HSP70)
MTDKVAVAIDFGNLKLRIGVRYNGKVEIINNEERYSAFSQILIHKKESSDIIFGFEAETNSIGRYKCCYREFKYNILNGQDKNDEMIVEILKYYKQLSEDYVNDRSNGEIKNIDKVILTIPSYDLYNKNIWEKLLIKCAEEAGFYEIITIYEDEAAILYHDVNVSEDKIKYFCLFNLGSLFFNSSIYEKGEKSIRMIYTSSKCIYSNKRFRRFFDELQNLFDEKLKQKLVDNILTKSEKYLAECYRKYHKLMDDFSGISKFIQLEFRYISDEPIEIEGTRNEMNQVLKNTHDEIKKLIFDTKKFLREKDLNMSSVTLLINGNGFKYPGCKDIFINEFHHNFRQRNVFYNEEVIKGALQNSKKKLFKFLKSPQNENTKVETSKQTEIIDSLRNKKFSKIGNTELDSLKNTKEENDVKKRVFTKH